MVDSDIFDNHVNSLVMELVTYVSKNVNEKVDKYNNNKTQVQEPQCAACELKDYFNGVVQLIGDSVEDEIHNIHEELLKRAYPYTDRLEEG